MIDINNFDAIRIGLASSKQIRDVVRRGHQARDDQYRTLKPEKDGLFCERIFGPTQGPECAAGKAHRCSIICERCGVEVTRERARAMGNRSPLRPPHLVLQGRPSRIGYLYIAPKELEKVPYFAASIVTQVEVESAPPT